MPSPPHPVTLRQLQYIVAVAERKSFRQAAEDCRVAQPSLSAQLAQAEEALGVRVFERDKHRVSVTAAGEIVVARARAVLVAADELVAAAKGVADPFHGTLRVGVIPTVAPYLLPEVAPALRERYPTLTLSWVEEKTAVLADSLERGALDAMIVALDDRLSALPHVVLGDDPFVFASPHGHRLSRGKRPLVPKDLDGERVLLLDDGHCFREQALSFCDKSGMAEAGYRATSLATLVQMAAGGAGVTLLPSLAVGVENRKDALTIRSFAPRPPSRTLALVWRKGSALEIAERAVGETLAQAYRALVKSRSS